MTPCNARSGACRSPGRQCTCHEISRCDVELKTLRASRTSTVLSTDSGPTGIDSPDDQSLMLFGEHSLKKPLTATAELRPSRTLSFPTWSRKPQGWRFGLVLNTSAAAFVLVMNVMLFTIAACKFNLADGIVSLYVGDCTLATRWNTGLHVLINALSSILLSASNYAMQCVTAPTRRECDAAHARGDWLDIGIAGTRNLRRIGYRRKIVWALLALSSMPIHLLYNSAVFKTLDANKHRYAVVGDLFLNAPSLNESQLTDDNRGMENTRLQYHEDPSSYEMLDAAACIAAYTGPFVSGHSNVLLVTTDPQYNYSDQYPLYSVVQLEYQDVRNGPLNSDYSWLDQHGHWQTGSPENSVVSASNWTMFDYKIDYCLARITEPHCKLQLSLYIMIPVMICNLIKAASMFWTLFFQREITLVTFGDALASWLDKPDKSTSHRCLMGKAEFTSSQKLRRTQDADYESVPTYNSQGDTPQPIIFSSTRVHRWSDAVSSIRWRTTMILCISSIIATIALFFVALGGAGGLRNPLTNTGFGAFNPHTIISIGMPQLGSTGLIACVLVANLPQLILSVLYLMYNGLYTCMHLAQEYSGYALERKPLRVTEPKGEQRSTYWLQLPYTYGLPLIVASSTLHWLVSQSIFLARVTVWQDSEDETPVNATGRNDVEYVTASTIGYSCAPMLCVIILGALMLLVAYFMGRRKLPSCIPVASSCSAAIAAAAHRPKSDVDASLLPVKWGVVSDSDTEVGHASFTSEEVTGLQEGKLYAGQGIHPREAEVRLRFRAT